MTQQRTVHTADLTAGELSRIRVLLEAAFKGDFDDSDWEHGLGGQHVLIDHGGGLVAHGSVVQRRVLHHGRSLRAGYIEAVAVRADARRRGLGSRVMRELERLVDGAYDLGALAASDEGAPLYAARDWWRWPGTLGTLGPSGPVPLPEEEGAVWVRSAPHALDSSDGLLFDWRDGDVL
ncbi:GNAT family N-acetyltransferase [Streptomyces tsukubensis]|uniref:Aminoglycoside 2'-N-acetyltransferase n=1 Tax=Streptomyces tsukubensis TaxID=83656 RepID=A0A1V4A9Y8_9ACTN|nr:GNAT family N-acetyltransferase [Streptomyces tsukubensis]OON79717.1 aminoglycoside 2'-N-acetyltransferase [Streptomyces tsukubensis]QFR95906.1 GNAT family N-acetyltransferase [Streptomyces tsukubensis]